MNKQKRRRYIQNVLMMTFILAAFCLASGVGAATALGGEATPHVQQAAEETALAAASRWDISMAIAVAIAIPCLAAGYAVGKVGAAALGAASEKPELLTRSLLFVALAEGIAIYGLLIAVLLYLKL